MDFEQIIQLQKARMGVYGTGNQDALINTTFDNFIENPAYRVVKHKDKIIGIHFITKSGQNRHKERYIISEPSTVIDIGDYILDEDDILWMCYGVDLYPIRKNYVDMCNHTLKFIDSNNNLITKPCIVSAKTLYNTGIKDEKVIEIPNGMVGIQLPYDEDTKKLERGQDFVFNKTKYKLTFYNEVEFDGLVVLICDETELSHLDDKVNGIADRWVQRGNEKIDRLPWLDDQEPPIEPEPTEPTEGISYTIIGQPQYTGDPDTEISINSWCKYTVKKLVDDVEVEGNFTFTLSDTKATLSEITNNSCKVSVGNIYGTSIIKLIAMDEYTGMTAIEKEITIKGR